MTRAHPGPCTNSAPARVAWPFSSSLSQTVPLPAAQSHLFVKVGVTAQVARSLRAVSLPPAPPEGPEQRSLLVRSVVVVRPAPLVCTARRCLIVRGANSAEESHSPSARQARSRRSPDMERATVPSGHTGAVPGSGGPGRYQCARQAGAWRDHSDRPRSPPGGLRPTAAQPIGHHVPSHPVPPERSPMPPCRITAAASIMEAMVSSIV